MSADRRVTELVEEFLASAGAESAEGARAFWRDTLASIAWEHEVEHAG